MKLLLRQLVAVLGLGGLLLGGLAIATPLSGSVTAMPPLGEDRPWIHTATVTPDDADEPGLFDRPSHSFAHFGTDIATDGERLAVMAHSVEKAYVFEKDEEGWTQTHIIDEYDRIGGSAASADAVAIDGDTLVIGAQNTDTGGGIGSEDPGIPQHGAVYVLEENAQGEWEETAYLEENPQPFEYFGAQVAIEEDTIVVGAKSKDSLASNSGSVFVYERTEDGWNLEAEFQGEMATMLLGRSVSINDGIIVAGTQKGDLRGDGGGLVKVYENVDGAWTETATVLPPEPMPTFSFGLDLHNGTMAVGASSSSNHIHGVGMPYNARLGEVFIYENRGGEWTLAARFENPIPIPGDPIVGNVGAAMFGRVVGIYEDRVVVGAASDDPHYAGSAYVYENTTGRADFRDDQQEWRLTGRLLTNETLPDDRFGWSVIAMEDRILVGAPFDNNRRDGTPYPLDNTGHNPVTGTDGRSAGSVYEFQLRHLSHIVKE